jgi:hypothetical protein
MKYFFDDAWCAKHCVEVDDTLDVVIELMHLYCKLPINFYYAKPHQPSTNSI